jgi:hypothetical protein
MDHEKRASAPIPIATLGLALSLFLALSYYYASQAISCCQTCLSSTLPWRSSFRASVS